MRHPFLTSIFLLIILSSHHTTSYFIGNTSPPLLLSNTPLGSAVRELNTNGACFLSQLTSFTGNVLQNPSIIYYNCNGNLLLGGYNVLGALSANTHDMYFQRLYSSIPSHNMVYLAMTVYELDSVDGNDSVDIYFDSTTFNIFGNFDVGNWKTGTICGNTQWDDLPNIHVVSKVAHSSSTLTLKFQFKNDEPSNNESWGFRDINILFATAATLPTNSICARTTIALPSAYQCTCPEGKYPDSGGVCQTCNSLCGSCFGSSAQQCYQCATGAWFDGTTCFACHSSCGICHGTGQDQCDTCATGYVLFNGKNCIPASSIVSPLKVVSTNPCQDTTTPVCGSSEYMYWDSSCLSSCPSPLKKVVNDPYFRLCTFPCSDNEYLYANGKCKSECDTPLKIEATAGRNLCLNPCTYPEILQSDGSCQVLSATAAKLPGFAGVLNYARFLKINYPLRLNVSITKAVWNVVPIKFTFDMPQEMQDKFTRESLPFAFERLHIPSRFLINFWKHLISFIIAFLIGTLFLILEVILKKWRLNMVASFFEQLKVLTNWNFLIILFATSLGDLVLYSSLEYQNSTFSNIADILSLVISVVLLTVLVIFLNAMYYLQLKLHHKDHSRVFPSSVKNDHLQNLNTSPLPYGVIREAFNQESMWSKLFYLIYTIRLALPSLIAASLFSYPLIQTALYVAISAGIILYTVIVKPLRSKVNFIQLILLEGIILVINAALLGLTVLHKNGLENSHTGVALGDLAIAGNLLIVALLPIFLVIKLAMRCHMLYKLKKGGMNISKALYVQIFTIYVQQGGMGFEEVFNPNTKQKAAPAHLAKEPVSPTQNLNSTSKPLEEISIVDSPVKPIDTRAANLIRPSPLEMEDDLNITPKLQKGESALPDDSPNLIGSGVTKPDIGSTMIGDQSPMLALNVEDASSLSRGNTIKMRGIGKRPTIKQLEE